MTLTPHHPSPITPVPCCPPLRHEQVEHARVFEAVGSVAAPGEPTRVAVALLAECGLGTRIPLLDPRPDHVQSEPLEGVFEEQEFRLGAVALVAIGGTIQPASRFGGARYPVNAVQ